MSDNYEIYSNKELEEMITSFRPVMKIEGGYQTLTEDSYIHALAVVLAHDELTARKKLNIKI